MSKPPKIVGSYTHVELVSREPERTREFLQQVFGWKTLDLPGPYVIFQACGDPHGGIRGPFQGERPGALPHIQVASIDETLAKVVAAGGKVVHPRTELPNGSWAVFEDPGGVRQALLETHEPDDENA